MTSRLAKVISSEDKGPSVSLVEYSDSCFIDTSPDRTEYKIEGINCTTREFTDWFLLVDFMGSGDFVSDSKDILIDIGGSCLDMSEGNILKVDFDDYFNAFLDMKIKYAHRDRDELFRKTTR